jgi:hypothetical protein
MLTIIPLTHTSPREGEQKKPYTEKKEEKTLHCQTPATTIF